MIIYPNKPVLFGVFHGQAEVKEGMEKFRQVIKGKRFLYLEITAEFLSAIPEYEPKVSISKLYSENVFKGMAGSYQLLAREAIKAGLKVIPMDDKKQEDRYQKAKQDQKLRIENMAYQNLSLREKRWESLLCGARSDTVVVAVSDHLRALQKRLKIPEQNCFMHQEHLASPDWRRQAEIEAKRIETERIARRLKEAKARNQRRQSRQSNKPK